MQTLNEEAATALLEVKDPIAPENTEKFVTLEQFQKHYRTFLERVQMQLGTLGGGGAVNIIDMDDLDPRIRENPTEFDGDAIVIKVINDPSGKPTVQFVPRGGIPIRGDIVADTLTVNGITTFRDNIDSSLIPEENEQYDLGSSTNRWRDLYLSGNSINIGIATISAESDGSIKLNDSTFSSDGAIEGTNLKINAFSYWCF